MASKKSKEQRAKSKVQEAPSQHSRNSRFPDYIVAVVLALAPFHAFLTVWVSSFAGGYTLVRLWPEFLMLGLLGWLFFTKQAASVWRAMYAKRLAWPMALYLFLNLTYCLWSLLSGRTEPQVAWYGLLLNTRSVAWLLVVYAVAMQGDWLKRHWQKIVLIPLAAVSAFAALQFFVLPPDFLSHFGYRKGVTIAPIQVINQDTETIRAQSTLRGPNPLGAYLLLGVVVATAFVRTKTWKYTLLAMSGIALFVSFSRSAWLGLVGAALAWIGTKKGFISHTRTVLSVVAAVLVLSVGFGLLLQNNQGFKNAVLHVNDQSTAPQTSNEDRLAALRSGFRDVLKEPIGRGVGTAGPASMREDATPARNSENYFLSIGQELGWFGLGLFLVICYRLARVFYERREPLSCALFAAFVGLTIVNLFSYAWADVTLAYLWWGLAAMSLAAGDKSWSSALKREQKAK